MNPIRRKNSLCEGTSRKNYRVRRKTALLAWDPQGATVSDMTSELTWGRRYLMCQPTHFDVAYAINPWMNLDVPVDRALAQRQWDALVAVLREAGAQIEVLEPVPGLPDLVFTANLGLVDGDTFIPARMRHPERRDEPAHAEPWFRDHGFRVRPLTGDVVQEGAGDALPFDGTLIGAYRTRSSAASYADLARMLEAAVERIRANPGIARTKTIIVLSTLIARNEP